MDPLQEALVLCKRNEAVPRAKRFELFDAIGPMGAARIVEVVKLIAWNRGVTEKERVQAWLFFGKRWFQALRRWFKVGVKKICLRTAELLVLRPAARYVVLSWEHATQICPQSYESRF